MTVSELQPLFKQGLQKFADNVEVNIGQLTVIKAIGVTNGDVCKPVYDLILKVMEDNIEKQKNAEIYHMRKLFDKDLQAFTQLFIPNNQATPKYLMTPMLHLLDENAIEKKINEATPNDIMSLYLIVSLRFDRNGVWGLMKEEKPFIERLEKYALLRSGDKKKLSTYIIQDQLLPLLEKIKKKM